MSSEKRLAKIEKSGTYLHNGTILCLSLEVKYEDGWCQDVGGVCLDTYDEELKCRVGTAWGCDLIRNLLVTFEVNDLSQLKGKFCWIYGDKQGTLSFNPKAISPLECDKGTTKEVSLRGES